MRSRRPAPVLVTLAGMRTGLEICYDVRFKPGPGAGAVAGADLLLLPALGGGTAEGGALAHAHPGARHREHRVGRRAFARCSDPDEPPTKAATGIGRSILVLSARRPGWPGPGPAVAVGEVDADLVRTVRGTVPSLYNRREDVFGSRSPSPARERAQRIGDCQNTGSSPPGEAVKPTPVSVELVAVRPVMAWIPGPVRPRPAGVNACHAAPFAEVHTTTSW